MKQSASESAFQKAKSSILKIVGKKPVGKSEDQPKTLIKDDDHSKISQKDPRQRNREGELNKKLI